MSDTISPYQARLYTAVIFGHDRARRKGSRLIRVLWLSRRRWQDRAAVLEARLRLVEALVATEQIAQQDPGAAVRADLINYAVNPDICFKPSDWAEALIEAKKYV